MLYEVITARPAGEQADSDRTTMANRAAVRTENRSLRAMTEDILATLHTLRDASRRSTLVSTFALAAGVV